MSERSALPLFSALALMFSWVAWAPLVAEHYGWLEVGPSVLHLLGSLGPAAAAFVVASWLGPAERGRLLARLVRWRVSGWAWAFAVLGPAAMLVLGLGVAALLGGPWPPLAEVLRNAEYPWLGPPALIAAQIVFYGLGEEVGWRGFALPRLIPRFGLVWASVVLSVPWAVWHLPLLLRNETYASMNPALLAGWFFSLLTGALLMTWLYQRARGSLLVLAVFHGLLDVVMVNGGVSQAALTVMGAAGTVAGVVAAGALWREQQQSAQGVAAPGTPS